MAPLEVVESDFQEGLSDTTGAEESAKAEYECNDFGYVRHHFEDMADGGLQKTHCGQQLEEATPRHDNHAQDVELFAISPGYGIRNAKGFQENGISVSGD